MFNLEETLEKVYYTLPLWMQNVGISLYGLYWYHRRYGGVFKEELKKCIARSDYTSKQWETYQTENLRKILLHAYHTVPYYTRLFSSLGLTDDKLSKFTISQLQELPLLNKETCTKYATTTMLSTKREPWGLYIMTSGSTGRAVNNLFSLRMQQQYYAIFEARILNWAGLNYMTPRCVIGGRRVLKNGIEKGPYSRYNFIEKQSYFSAYHLSPKTVRNYVEEIKKSKAVFMTGYASANFFLARFIEEAGLEPPKIKAVVTSADTLTNEMRDTFKRVYGCETFNSYNGVEANCLISECEFHRLHIVPDVGIVEVLNKEGEPCKPGETGEVVATGLLNYDQPMIRFRMGDLITLSKDQTCQCGRSMPLVDEIVGRIEDTVIGPDGREMRRFQEIFMSILSIVEGQIIQNTINDFDVNVVATKDLKETDIELMKTRMRSQLGDINVKVHRVESIPKGANGKFKGAISKVKRNEHIKCAHDLHY